MAGYLFRTSAGNTPQGDTVPLSPNAGDLLVLLSSTSSGGGNPTVTISDDGTGGSGWITPINNEILSGDSHRSVAYCLSAAAGITTITANYNGGTPGQCALAAAAYYGMTSPAFEGISTTNYQVAPGAGTDAITANPFTVVAHPAIVIGLMEDDTHQYSGVLAGTGFTARSVDPDSVTGLLIEDLEATSPGSVTATFTADPNYSRGNDSINSWTMVFSEGAAIPPVVFKMYANGTFTVNSISEMASLPSGVKMRMFSNSQAQFLNIVESTVGYKLLANGTFICNSISEI